MLLALIEDPADELSQQAFAFARGFGEPVSAVAIDGAGSYAPAAWAQTLVELIAQRSPSAVVAPGTDRGNEVLAHVAAKLDQPMAANCVSVTPGSPATVIRTRWGGSLLEEARVHGSPTLLTAAAHAVGAEPVSDARGRAGVARRPRSSTGRCTWPSTSRRPPRGCRWPRRMWSSPAAAGSARPRASP